jgi:hypothetical protein
VEIDKVDDIESVLIAPTKMQTKAYTGREGMRAGIGRSGVINYLTK